MVLVSPRNPLNIGAAARAMANFGFTQLSVVAPYETHWREAKSAVGAEELLQNAKVAASIEEAVAACTLVVGTGSLERRKAEQTVVALPALAPLVGEELARAGRVALVFGPEKRGLTRNDLALCHLLAEIPTGARQPSMNLGQAVAVCLYEIAARLFLPTATQALSGVAGVRRTDGPADSPAPRAPSARLEALAEVVEEAMAAADYSPHAMRAANARDLRLLLRRLSLTDRDARRILGLFRRILWRLRH